LAQQLCQKVARVLATPKIRQGGTCKISQPKNLVELAVGQEPGIRGDPAAVEFEL
jgi:hypothetical protein